jgi:hypothetical protein
MAAADPRHIGTFLRPFHPKRTDAIVERADTSALVFQNIGIGISAEISNHDKTFPVEK